MTTAFRSEQEAQRDAAVIERAADVSDESSSLWGDTMEAFEVERTAEWLKSNNASLVALQLADDSLPMSASLVSNLSSLCPDMRFFILGDTTLGACCVDVVAAQHICADAIVHYGRACFAKTSSIPVFYVLGRQNFDLPRFLTEMETQEMLFSPSSPTIILLSSPFAHLFNKMNTLIAEKKQGKEGDNVLSPIVAIPSLLISQETVEKKAEEEKEEQQSPSSSSSLHLGPYRINHQNSDLTSFDKSKIVYIGQEGPELTQIMMENAMREFYIYNESSSPSLVKTGQETNRLLKKRYFLVHKLKDLERIGLLVSSSAGLENSLEIIARCKRVIAQAGKKSYLFVVGKINAAKLANFAEIEAFVVISCPQTTIISGDEYYQPLVTPYELEIALIPGKQWSGEYKTNFQQLLSEPLPAEEEDKEKGEDDEDDDDAGDVSLITGKIRKMNKDKTSSAMTVFSPAGEFLKSREFQGLEFTKKKGDGDQEEEEGAEVTEGREGLAWEYNTERE